MTITYVTLKGTIKDGELHVNLPENIRDGEVELTVAVENGDETEAQPWTDEELQEMLKFEGKTLGEIVESEYIGSWADMGITDGAAWVQEQRRKMWAERRARWTDS